MRQSLRGRVLILREAEFEGLARAWASFFTFPGFVQFASPSDVKSPCFDFANFDYIALFHVSLAESVLLDVFKLGGSGCGFFFVSCTFEGKRSPQRALLFAGFVDVSALDSVLVARRPAWSVDASQVPSATQAETNQETSESGPAKKKACKNCSCGRAEIEARAETEAEAKQLLESGAVQSSCGSCYLGDDFRCDSCPYRGLPPFKPGDKVLLKP